MEGHRALVVREHHRIELVEFPAHDQLLPLEDPTAETYLFCTVEVPAMTMTGIPAPTTSRERASSSNARA